MLVLMGVLIGGCEEEYDTYSSVSYPQQPGPQYVLDREEEEQVKQEDPNKVMRETKAVEPNKSEISDIFNQVCKNYNKEVNKPIFGVYLGEPFRKLAERAREEWKCDLTQTREPLPGQEGAIIRVKHREKDGPLFIYLSEPFEERVYIVHKLFLDASVDNYREIKDALKKKYPDVTWNAEEGTYAEFSGTVVINEVNVGITLKCVVGYGMDTLELMYIHVPLAGKTLKEIELRKEKRLSDNL
jgi:hypothetical protein